MDKITTILWVSVLVQGAAVVLALRLIPLSRHAAAWILLSTAFLLMMGRRSLTLLQHQGVVHGAWVHTFTIESVALVISVLMLLGINSIRQFFVERQKAENTLRKLSLALARSPSGALITDTEGNIEYVNPAFTAVTGYTEAEVLGRNTRILKAEGNSADTYTQLWQTITAGNTWRGELRNRKKNGDTYWESVSIAPMFDDAGTITHYVTTFEDITERKAQAEALHYQVVHDPLTGLPNRLLFYDRLQHAAHNASRKDETFSVLIMDLDRFKDINDTLGHHYGDRVLQEVGARLQNALRESDTVARLGGDEFAILLSDTTPAQCTRVVEKLLAALHPAFKIEDHAIDIHGSIGIVYFREHGDDADALLQRADVAMYIAKRSGTRFAVYDPDQDPHTLTRLTLMTDLRQAIQDKALTLHYQPKMNLNDGRVIGVEALVRWPHPVHGWQTPEIFVPMAEQATLIKPLTRWVLEAAIGQCGAWLEQGLELCVSVNVSPRDLEDGELPRIIAELLSTNRLTPGHLIIELTENAIMSDPAHTLLILSELNEMGVKLSIDDFGTGYSSLSNLKSLPVSELKIDRGFVLDMLHDENDAIIVRSTIDLAHNLGLKVVAEGVEDHDSWNLLSILGCDLAQGYHICRPVHARDLTYWLETGSNLSGASGT